MELTPEEKELKELNKDERFIAQLRYFFQNNRNLAIQTELLSNISQMLKWICESMGIDVKAKRQEEAKIMKEVLAKQGIDLKEQIEEYAKK